MGLRLARSGTAAVRPWGSGVVWVCSRACLQVCFEVFISEHLVVQFGDDHQETNPHLLRIGWSTDASDLQLGNGCHAATAVVTRAAHTPRGRDGRSDRLGRE